MVFGHCWSCGHCCAGPSRGRGCVVPAALSPCPWGCGDAARGPGTHRALQDTQLALQLVFGASQGCAHSSALCWSTQWPGQAGGSGQGPPWDQQSQIISSVCPWRRGRQLPSPHSARFMLWGGQRGKSVCEEGLGAEMFLPSLQVSGCAPRRLWLLGELCSFSVRFPACSR